MIFIRWSIGLGTTSRALCCADILCYFGLELLLIKNKKLMVFFKLNYVHDAGTTADWWCM